MDSELKEETVTALKSGIEFLGNVKKELGQNNELKSKLIHIHYLFEGLVNKWENILQDPDAILDKKAKTSKSFPLFHKKVNSQQDLRENIEVAETRRKEHSKSINTDAVEKKDERNIKSKSNLLQRFKRRSTIEDKEFSTQKEAEITEKKKLSDRAFVRMPATEHKNLDEDGYLKIEKPPGNHIMNSENKFKKLAKIKLIVNGKALGARYCAILDKVILLGKALNDQPPEFELNLEEYGLNNHKGQVFDLVKENMILSLRFATEIECSDWFNMLDQMTESGLYSYVTVGSPRSSVALVKNNVDYENVSKKRTQGPIVPEREMKHHYCYPRFSQNPVKLDSCEYVKIIEEDVELNRDVYREKSKPIAKPLVSIQNIKRSSAIITSCPPIISNKPKTHNHVLGRDRSMSA